MVYCCSHPSLHFFVDFVSLWTCLYCSWSNKLFCGYCNVKWCEFNFVIFNISCVFVNKSVRALFKSKLLTFFFLTLSFTIQNQDGNDHMAYWLSNTSALLFLLEQSLKSGSSTNATPVRKPPNPTSLFGRMTMVMNIS